MDILFPGHAQLWLEVDGRHLLLDPWFAEPVFGHAWWRYPPPPYPTPESLPGPIDLLLLSHIHPDHSGPGTLATMSPDTPTALLPFPSQRLVKRVAQAGYSQVTHMRGFETQELLPGVRVTFVPHDRGWEVSSIVVEANGVRVYHGNDNTLSVAGYQEVVSRLGPIDIAFLPYAGASSFPTGFEGDQATLKARCAAKKAQGVARLTDGIEGLQPRIAVPFASSWALLEERELWKNYLDRPTPFEAADGAAEVAARHGTELLVLHPGDRWRKDSGPIRGHKTKGWGYDQESIARYARQQAPQVAAALTRRRGGMDFSPQPAALERAFVRYFEVMLRQTQAGTAKLDLCASFVADHGAEQQGFTVRFKPGQSPTLSLGADAEAQETLTLDASELWGILTTSLNWEDPWYGYRLRVRKAPGAGYYRAFWEMLLNFDDEALSAAVLTEVLAESSATSDTSA